MAFFDPGTGQLVLHLVYDGAPLSGKTASVQSLGRLLNRPVISPEVRDGRTLLFDWLEYEGGVRYGRPIVCRVMTVPGQVDLAHRRIRLLRSADGIVFVADSRREAFAETLEQWTNLQMLIARWELTTPVILQINKRDAEDVMSVDEVIGRFGADRISRHFDTEAIHDLGTRETFVLSVGETLRQLMKSDALRRHLTETQPIQPVTPTQLAEILRSCEEPRSASAALPRGE